MHSLCTKCLLPFLLFVLVPWSFGTQNSPTTGALVVTVHDTSGAVVAGATVAVRNIATNQTRQTISADDGSCRFLALPAGDYEVRGDLSGFNSYVHATVAISLG